MPQPPLDAGGSACGNGREVAEQADVIIVMVPDTPHVEAVLFSLIGRRRQRPVGGQDRGGHEGGFASSKIPEIHGERMVRRTFDPGFRIELHQKDLKLALSSARQLGLSLPNTATVQELFNACAAHGGRAWDHSAMVRALEFMANFEIGQPPAEAN